MLVATDLAARGLDITVSLSKRLFSLKCYSTVWFLTPYFIITLNFKSRFCGVVHICM